MSFDNKIVPFKITGVSYGLKEVIGFASLSEQCFQVEYQLRDSFVGMWTTDTRLAAIDYADLDEISFEKGWFSGKIILKGNTMDAFEGLPGTRPGLRTLKVDHKDREKAAKLVSQLRMLLSEYRLNEMEG